MTGIDSEMYEADEDMSPKETQGPLYHHVLYDEPDPVAPKLTVTLLRKQNQQRFGRSYHQ